VSERSRAPGIGNGSLSFQKGLLGLKSGMDQHSHAAYAAETAEIPPIPAGNIRGPRLTLRAINRSRTAGRERIFSTLTTTEGHFLTGSEFVVGSATQDADDGRSPVRQRWNRVGPPRFNSRR
jgi:hypothetical protein